MRSLHVKMYGVRGLGTEKNFPTEGRGETKMKTRTIAAALLSLAAVAVPAAAQKLTFAQMAQGMARGDLGKAWPVGYQQPAIAKTPWRPVTSQEMAAAQRDKRAYKLSAQVDYNGDNVVDTAYLATNGKQGAVVVQLGGGKGTVVAFRTAEPMLGGEELAPAGKRRIVVNFPESSMVVLSAETGKPAVYYIGD